MIKTKIKNMSKMKKIMKGGGVLSILAVIFFITTAITHEDKFPYVDLSTAKEGYYISKEGYAKLQVIDDRVLQPGEMSIVAPPAEIHSFTALTDDTWSVTIVGGCYKPDRHYYDPANNSCRIANPKKQKVVQ